MHIFTLVSPFYQGDMKTYHDTITPTQINTSQVSFGGGILSELDIWSTFPYHLFTYLSNALIAFLIFRSPVMTFT